MPVRRRPPLKQGDGHNRSEEDQGRRSPWLSQHDDTLLLGCIGQRRPTLWSNSTLLQWRETWSRRSTGGDGVRYPSCCNLMASVSSICKATDTWLYRQSGDDDTMVVGGVLTILMSQKITTKTHCYPSSSAKLENKIQGAAMSRHLSIGDGDVQPCSLCLIQYIFDFLSIYSLTLAHQVSCKANVETNKRSQLHAYWVHQAT